jgi:peptidyl-prolyl cis-trans isomerase D
MLSWFRKHARSRWVKALFYFIALTFFGGFGILSSSRVRSCAAGGRALPDDPVAHVKGNPITYEQLQRAVNEQRRYWLEMMREQHEGDIPDSLMESIDFKSQVMDQIAQNILLLSKAREWGITVSNAEVREAIAQSSFFRDRTGRFNRQIYLEILSRQGKTEGAYEAEIRDQLAMAKLIGLVSGSAVLLEGEARGRYIFEHEKINLGYLSLDIDERFQDARPTEEEIREYYEDNKEKFDLPETRKLRFFRFHVPDYEEKVKLSEKELNDFYSETKARYLLEPEKARLRHILIRVSRDDTEEKIEEARSMAEDLAARARAGDDFAELARTYSEDDGTKDQGGYLGEVVRGTAIPQIDEAAFGLLPGGVSDPVLTQYGFHVLRLEDKTAAKFMPFDEVKDEVQENLLRIKAFTLATLDANTVESMLNAGKSMKEVAEENGIALYTSEFFHRQEQAVPDIPDFYQVSHHAFLLQMGEISEKISGLDDLYIIELAEIAEPHQASIEESREKIERIITPEIKKKRARKEARAYLEELKAGADIKKVAKKAGLSWQETGLFPRAAEEVPGIGYSEELKAAAFRLGPDQPWPEDVYEVSRNMVIIHFKEVEPADIEEFEKNPDEFEQQMLYEKQQEVTSNFIESLKQDAVTYTELYERVY